MPTGHAGAQSQYLENSVLQILNLKSLLPWAFMEGVMPDAVDNLSPMNFFAYLSSF